MSSVSFDDEQQYARHAVPTGSGGLTGWLIRKGLTSDQRSAQRVMLMVAGVCILVAILAPLLLGGNDESGASEIEIREAIRPLKAR